MPNGYQKYIQVGLMPDKVRDLKDLALLRDESVSRICKTLIEAEIERNRQKIDAFRRALHNERM